MIHPDNCAGHAICAAYPMLLKPVCSACREKKGQQGPRALCAAVTKGRQFPAQVPLQEAQLFIGANPRRAGRVHVRHTTPPSAVNPGCVKLSLSAHVSGQSHRCLLRKTQKHTTASGHTCTSAFIRQEEEARTRRDNRPTTPRPQPPLLLRPNTQKVTPATSTTAGGHCQPANQPHTTICAR